MTCLFTFKENFGEILFRDHDAELKYFFPRFCQL